MTSHARILVTDDEFPTREICCDVLIENGYQIKSASNGKEALQVLAQEPFHILLSDIQMPEMDGIALLRESKKLYPDLEVILMTAYGGLPSAVEALRSGAYDYLTKPLSLDVLLNTMRRCMEKIELRQKLKESQKKLVEQERLAALGGVAAWLSHKMRNSLSVILMCSHYLQEKEIPESSSDLKEVVRAIIDKVKALEKTTSELISYSRSYELQKSREDLNALVEDAIRSLQIQMQIQNIRLVKQLAAGLPMILCDRHILNEAFENIFMNALQAIGTQAGQTLTVRTELLASPPSGYAPAPTYSPESNPQEAQGNAVMLTVANTGSAIPKGTLENIFKPFYTTKETGSGLGLAIVQKILEQHNGHIYVETGERDGKKQTAMKLVFPAAVEEGGKPPSP